MATRPAPRRHPITNPLCWLPLLALVGCGSPWQGSLDDGPGLRVATPWPVEERLALEHEFRDWLREREPAIAADTARLVWLDATSARRADVILGGPLVEYVRMARKGELTAPQAEDSEPFLRLEGHAAGVVDSRTDSAGSIALDDPRIAPVMLAWCDGLLRSGPWIERYAGLIRLAGQCRVPVGWRAGMAQAAIDRGEADRALQSPPTRGEPAAAVSIAEGVAILRGSASEQAAQAFLRFLSEERGAKPVKLTEAPDPDLADLMADLLGAVLVDAQDELVAAWSALGGVDAAPPSAARDWLTEPPPWPPASVEKLLTRGDDRGLLLVHDLAGHLAPDPELRLWLIQSWLRPRRTVDAALLKELAGALGGRLAREPRFRGWLRGEWTAWARQRYRRVARLAAGAVPTS